MRSNPWQIILGSLAIAAFGWAVGSVVSLLIGWVV